jgi:hypothetical protein
MLELVVLEDLSEGQHADLGVRRKRGWCYWVKRGNAVVRRQVEQVGCVLREVRGGGRSKS